MTEERIRDLLALDPIEQMAKEYYERTGENMRRSTYVSLREDLARGKCRRSSVRL